MPLINPEHSLVRGLIRDWETVADHEAKPDPHPQYALEVDALAAFSLAAYGGIHYLGPPIPKPNFGGGWQDLDFANTLTVATPKQMTASLLGYSLTLDLPGVYIVTLNVSFNHASSNSGRLIHVRLFDQTDQSAMGSGFQVATGRNAEATVCAISMLTEAEPAIVGHELIAQIGGGDSYSNIEFTTMAYSIHSAGEYRGELGALGVVSGSRQR